MEKSSIAKMTHTRASVSQFYLALATSLLNLEPPTVVSNAMGKGIMRNSHAEQPREFVDASQVRGVGFEPTHNWSLARSCVIPS